MKYHFILNNLDRFKVACMCKVLKINKSSYYSWKQRGVSQQKLRRQKLSVLIKDIYEANHRTYGARKVYEELLKLNIKISFNTVASIMSEHRLFGVKKRKFKITTNSDHPWPIAPNILQQDFNIKEANKAWASDITYIRTAEGWLYLAVVMDLYSRKIVGWSMSERMKSQLPIDALQMALNNRRPQAGLIHHSDRGSQYASAAFQRKLKANGIIPSMSARGNCYDNAVVESFFSSLKLEWIYNRPFFKTRQQARGRIFEYIEGFYNTRRSHSYLGYLAPNEFEAM